MPSCCRMCSGSIAWSCCRWGSASEAVNDLARQAGVTWKRCREASRLFHVLTTSQPYLELLADPDSVRCNLAGRIGLPVSDEHRQAAVEALKPAAGKRTRRRRTTGSER